MFRRKKPAKRKLGTTKQRMIAGFLGTAVGAGVILYPMATGGSPPPPPDPGTANIWVNDSNSPNGSCTRSSTPVVYNSTTACNPNDDVTDGALDAAYTIAQAGDLIGIQGGTYTAAQEIRARALGAPPVRFFVEVGETATFDNCITIHGTNITLDGGSTLGTNDTDRIVIPTQQNAGCTLDIQDQTALDANVIAEDIDSPGAYINSDGVTLRYSDLGPLQVCDFSVAKADVVLVGGAGAMVSNITLEYNLIHDLIESTPVCGLGDLHDDLIEFRATESVIRGNRMWRCGTQCLFNGEPSQNVVIENNMISIESADRGSTATGFSGDGTIYQYNTVDGNVTFGGGAVPTSNVTVKGNVFLTSHSCDGAGTYTFNTFPAAGGSTCGTNSQRCAPTLNSTGSAWTDTDADAEWHISTADTCAREHGDTGSMPAKDLDEQNRPNGTVDAGADEVGG